MTHPGEIFDVTHEQERRLHLPVADENAPLWRKAVQFAEDFGVQTVEDPATWVPGLDVFSVGKRALGAAKLIPGVAKAGEAVAKSKPLDALLSHAVEGHDLGKSVTWAGADIVKGYEGAARMAARREESRYAELVEQHRGELDAGNIPPEIQAAFQQRAYREGTPEVRRHVLSLGYKPTAEDRAHGPLNILHAYRDVYEPTQKVLTPEELAASAGPVTIIHQGDRKAGFDLPKSGTTAASPLADRVLDRLVRGARLEQYHASRRSILGDLGLLPQQPLGPLGERLSNAAAAGDTKRLERYGKVLAGRNAAEKAQEAKRAATLVPNAPMVEGGRRLEFTAPQTARERALRQLQVAGAPGILEKGTSKAGKDLGFLRQLDRGQTDVRGLLGAAHALAPVINRERKLAATARGAVPKIERAAKGVQSGEASAAQRTFAEQEIGAPIRSAAAKVEAAGQKIGQPTRSLRGVVGPAQQSARLAELMHGSTRAKGQQVMESLQRLLKRNAAVADARDAAAARIEEGNVTALPKTLDERLFGPKVKVRPGPLKGLADVSRDALFIMPFAHMKNIAVLQALGEGGPAAVARGAAYAAKLAKDPAALADRVQGLERIGATAHYIGRTEPWFAKLGKPGAALGKMSAASRTALEQYDTGMRLALQDALEAKGVTGFQAAGKIRDTLGDYENTSELNELLRNWAGAPFPAWGLGIVPKAMGKALREQPQAVKAYARAAAGVNADVTGPGKKGSLFDLGGPAEDAAKLALAPQDFLTSPSRIGPVAMAFGAKDALKRGQLGEQVGGDLLRLIPGGTLASQALSIPSYPNNAPAAERLGASLFGAYLKPKTTIAQRTRQLEALGMKPAEVRAQLTREGYFPLDALGRTAP
ncbi:MAG: hypothetical protein WAJ85_10130 [Candidatus Baltobacteraceae bacterium]